MVRDFQQRRPPPSGTGARSRKRRRGGQRAGSSVEENVNTGLFASVVPGVTSPATSSPQSKMPISPQGVGGPTDRLHSAHLKAAELVTRRLLLAGAVPAYHELPPPPLTGLPARFLGPDGFSALHAALDPASRGAGAEASPTGGTYGVPERRADRKRSQIVNVVRAAAALVENVAPKGESAGVLVDMCGGCGHVGLVFAALYPAWDVVVVDIKPYALRVVEQRASEAALDNVRVVLRDIAEFKDPFDIAIALHACGDASDIVLDVSMRAGAAAVVAPCCLGGIVSPKTKSSVAAQRAAATALFFPKVGPCTVAPAQAASEKSTSITETVARNWRLPRSEELAVALRADEYELLVRAADFGEDAAHGDDWRRAAKTIVEGDRLGWLAQHQYQVRLSKMHPLTCTPKNDMLIVWPGKWQIRTDSAAVDGNGREVLYANRGALDDADDSLCRENRQRDRRKGDRQPLVQRPCPSPVHIIDKQRSGAHNPWEPSRMSGSWEWEMDAGANDALTAVIGNSGLFAEFDADTIAEVSRLLYDRVASLSSCGEMRFPASQGARARKAVHQVASTLGMHHESFGRGQDRYVVVRRSLSWPLFFDSGFVGYGGTWVAETAREMSPLVPAEHVARRDTVRAGRAHHMTVVGAKEVRLLPYALKGDMRELVATLQALLKQPHGLESGSSGDPRAVGVGRVVDPADDANDAYYVVVEWPAGAAARAKLGLPPHDFHITLGFRKRDVHGIRKDCDTLISDLI
jgi:SAM-dependent methyltransferase